MTPVSRHQIYAVCERQGAEIPGPYARYFWRHSLYTLHPSSRLCLGWFAPPNHLPE